MENTKHGNLVVIRQQCIKIESLSKGNEPTSIRVERSLGKDHLLDQSAFWIRHIIKCQKLQRVIYKQALKHRLFNVLFKWLLLNLNLIKLLHSKRGWKLKLWEKKKLKTFCLVLNCTPTDYGRAPIADFHKALHFL